LAVIFSPHKPRMHRQSAHTGRTGHAATEKGAIGVTVVNVLNCRSNYTDYK